MNRGLTEIIADLGPSLAWVGVGQVTAVESHPQWGWLATVTLQPSGQEVQARILGWGARAAGGGFWPVEVDDEVLVLMPEGDPNRAICIGGLTSSEAAIPSSWNNADPMIVHPSGLRVSTSQAATLRKVVLETLLPDLQTSLTELSAGLAALGMPTTQTATFLGQLPAGYRSVGVRSE